MHRETRRPIARSTLLLLSIAAATTGGCDTDASAPGADPQSGTVELSLSTVPPDAACLRVVAMGSRSVTRLFSLIPGTTPTFMIDRLPVGIVQVDGQAFSAVCGNLTGNVVPTWTAEAPIPVHIDPISVGRVALKLIRNGRISVAVDFELPPWISPATTPVDLAVFGDAPYGGVQIADFPRLIADINLAPGISEVVHLGDIKNGSSLCETTYFQYVFDNVNRFDRPFLFTPGDNEWTDCHRANNGAYDPLERLGVLRSMFYPVPGLSLGVHTRQVLSQSFFPGFEAYPENQLWVEAAAVFSLVHAVGSNNGLLPWFTDDTTGTKVDDPTRRIGEETARDRANLDWLDRTFATAASEGAKAVIVMMQANMWDGTPVNGFDATVQRLAALTLAFGKPVLLLEGDSHIFLVDNPLATGDPVHGVTTPVPNLTRVVVQGSTTSTFTEWVRLHVDPAASPPFSWTRMAR